MRYGRERHSAPRNAEKLALDDVVAFLRDHLRRKKPAWKRRKIIQSLICYRRYVQSAPFDDLTFIRTKLEDLARAEKAKAERLNESGEDMIGEIDDVIGHIDPSEPDVIQNLRRTMRLRHDVLETERAYVSNVRAFMRDQGLKCQADFARIVAADVEAHLTDLAVDGNVAASTQNRAFYALLYLFQHVLKREMGEVRAIRSSKEKQIPTVLSLEVAREVAALLSELSSPADDSRSRREADPGHIAVRRVGETGPALAARSAGPPRTRLRWWSHAGAFLRRTVLSASSASQDATQIDGRLETVFNHFRHFEHSERSESPISSRTECPTPRRCHQIAKTP